MKLKHFLTGRKFMTNFDNIKKQRHYYANKCLCTQSYGFSSHHVWMWELDSDVSWGLKNWSFWTAVLEKTLESPLDSKEIQPIHPKGNQSWLFIGRTDVEPEAPKLWPPNVKSQIIGKDPDAGKVEGRRRRGRQRMRWLDGITDSMHMSLRKALGAGDGQGSLACYSPWACKKSDTIEWLN